MEFMVDALEYSNEELYDLALRLSVQESIKFEKAGRLIITGLKGIKEVKTSKNKNIVPQQNLKT